MAIDQETYNTRLFKNLDVRGYKPVPKDANNERTNPQLAEIIEFQFIKDGENYGKCWATIDKASQLKIYYDTKVSESPPGQTKGVEYDDSWYGLIKHLKKWAMDKQLSFDLIDNPKQINGDMKQREHYKMKEKTNEAYHAVNKTTSYNDNIPNVKVVIQHDRAVQEGEQRWRNVQKIFVENTEGERFAVPTRMPGIARVYGRHVAEGGTPYDERGKHITALVEEYTKMAGFVRATRKGQFNESVAKLIAEGINHHKSLKESLQRMQSHRGYNHYFESWTPPLMEDESDSSSIAEMFAQDTIDPRIESVLPILNRLNSGIINEIEEVNELDQWAKGITEITEAQEERPYICVHARKGRHECHASSSYEAVKKAADHWKLKSTAGIDAYLADVTHSTASLEEDSGCACGCGPKDKCTCDASCTKCDCAKDDLKEGAMSEIHIDAQEMSKEEFTKKHPKFAKDYDSINASARDEKKPTQGELALQGELNLKEESVSKFDVKAFVANLEKQYSDDEGSIKLLVKQRVLELKAEYRKSKHGDANTAKKIRFLEQYLQREGYAQVGTAATAAEREMKKQIGTFGRGKIDPSGADNMDSKISIGKALSGIIGMAAESLNEFQEEDFDDDREDAPKKYKPILVDMEGNEVDLPYHTKDFRGDPLTVIGFEAPRHTASSGRIYTDTDRSFFPSVAKLKIINHEFDDNLDEAGMPSSVIKNKQRLASMSDIELAKLLGSKSSEELKQMAWRHGYKMKSNYYIDRVARGSKVDESGTKTGAHGYTVHTDGAPLSFADWCSENKSEDAVSTDNRSKDELEASYKEYRNAVSSARMQEDNELSEIRKLSGHTKEASVDETSAGGMDFAGHFKTGPAGQWKNTGKTKGKPAKVGDLVGAEESADPLKEDEIEYGEGDLVILRGQSYYLHIDGNGTIWAEDDDGGSYEFIPGTEQHHDPAGEKEEEIDDIDFDLNEANDLLNIIKNIRI